MARASNVFESRRRAQLVAQWRNSSEAQAAFARRHGVHPRTFWGWCQAEADEAPRRDMPTARFVPVHVVDDAAASPPGELEVVLTSGERLVLRGASVERLLAHALTVLRGAC